ncbi:hypothetical protein BJV82DRAFT_333323 [Fennellomyces sp. T-0311]|nr:hypothetical protein BJV82DRAFT_333323 [Fennellomyces sp. T-0311]
MGWFFIQSTSHPNHVLTVINAAWQPGARIELRPLVGRKHQLWCFDDGFLVNKHSGCVMSVKSEKAVENQTVIQARRQENEASATQRWLYDDEARVLKLRAHPGVRLGRARSSCLGWSRKRRNRTGRGCWWMRWLADWSRSNKDATTTTTKKSKR